MSERDDKGRFQPGNRASPGRRARRTERQYLDTTIAAVNLADWKKITGTAVKLAIEGDDKARRWLSDYLIGKPPQILELKGAEALTLSQVLEAFKSRGIAPAEVFQSLLTELDAGADDDTLTDDDESADDE